MSRKSRTPYRGLISSFPSDGAGLDLLPFSGAVVSRSYEPAPGWRGILAEILPNALVFRTDEGCSPLLPTLLPAYCLISPGFPDSPGSARVKWSAREEPRETASRQRGDGDPWMPAALRAAIRPGAVLSHQTVLGSSVWRIEGFAALLEARDVTRPRLVLAPPRRRDPREVQRALAKSLFRAMRSVPPENDLKHLVEVSRSFVTGERSAAEDEGMAVLSELVGFGAGRTACGDDFLVGFICGLDLGASVDPRIDPNRFHEFRALAVGAVHRSIERTSLLGHHVLLAAFHGLYSAPLLDEADALSDGIVVGPGEPEWTLQPRPTVSPGWPALLGLLTGTSVAASNSSLVRTR